LLFLNVLSKEDFTASAVKGLPLENLTPSLILKIVERNENYWGGKPGLAKVTFKCINDQSTRAILGY